MDNVVRGLLSFWALLWHWLDHAADALGVLHRQVRAGLDALHVPAALDGGIIASAWAIVLFMAFRALPAWGRMALVFGVAVLLAKIYGPPATR